MQKPETPVVDVRTMGLAETVAVAGVLWCALHNALVHIAKTDDNFDFNDLQDQSLRDFILTLRTSSPAQSKRARSAGIKVLRDVFASSQKALANMKAQKK